MERSRHDGLDAWPGVRSSSSLQRTGPLHAGPTSNTGQLPGDSSGVVAARPALDLETIEWSAKLGALEAPSGARPQSSITMSHPTRSGRCRSLPTPVRKSACVPQQLRHYRPARTGRCAAGLWKTIAFSVTARTRAMSGYTLRSRVPMRRSLLRRTWPGSTTLAFTSMSRR